MAKIKIEKCERCKKEFERKWSPRLRNWSQVNDVHYWTEGKDWNNWRILCKSCLNYWFEEEWKNFHELVSAEKSAVFRAYRYDKTL